MNPLNQGLLMGEGGQVGGRRARRESDTPVTSKPPTMFALPGDPHELMTLPQGRGPLATVGTLCR